ncbi:DUF4442 domain-containing protein [Nonomuraea recticatena]|uniref:DUF4442 domain-containing protein n=1 Tax=Nonomuraea recticatena TaxID=46178 RepID=UPI003621F559
MSYDVGELLLQTVPFARTRHHLRQGRGRCGHLPPARPPGPAQPRRGPHAGALFALAESASGAATLATFGDQLSRAVPLPTTATIRYRKVAMGEVVAEARLLASRDEVVAKLDAGERPEFDVAVEIRNAEGTTVSEMTVSWTLRPNR